MKITAKRVFCFLTCAIACFFLVSEPALAAAPSFWIWHRTDCRMEDGKTVYDDGVNFTWLLMGIANVPASSKGSLTIKNGGYTYGTWNEGPKRRQGSGTHVAGTTCQLDLKIEKNGTISASSAVPVNAKGESLLFWGEADAGVSEKSLSYVLGKTAKDIVLPKIYSTQEQLDSYVPYLEYALEDGKIKDLTLRIVKPKDTVTALVKNDVIDFGVLAHVDFWGRSPRWQQMKIIKVDKKFKNGDTLEATIAVKPPLDPRSIGVIGIHFSRAKQDKNSEVWYKWHFYPR